MKVVRIINKGILFAYCLFKHGSIRLAYILSFYNVSLFNINLIQRQGDYIYFPNTNRIHIRILSNFYFTINLLFAFASRNEIKITDTNYSYFTVSINGLLFKVASLSNFAVLYEIFVQKLYEVSIIHKDIVVVDIGMNVGVASLYFANYPNVKAVYAYEPFPETYNEALYNFKLNPEVSKKIKSFNFGISDKTCSKVISSYQSGMLSASTILNEDNFGKIPNKVTNVNLISIKECLTKVYLDNPDNRIILKVDCEGEEYAIFKSIMASDFFNNINCILLEWHEYGIEELTDIMLKNGFQYFHVPNENFNSGMIYAFKN